MIGICVIVEVFESDSPATVEGSRIHDELPGGLKKKKAFLENVHRVGCYSCFNAMRLCST